MRKLVEKLPERKATRAVELLRELERRQLWQKDPISWAVERLGIPREMIDWELLPQYQNHRWDGTRNPFKILFEAVAEGKWVGIEGATGTSKTYFIAVLALWFLENFEGSLVPTIAPKEEQLGLQVWKEIQRFYPHFARGKLGMLQLRMEPPKDEWQAFGFVAGVKAEEVERSATKAQGMHSEHMLVVMEETPGIAQAVMTAFENTCTAPHNIVVATGNPDHQLDTLHKFCQQKQVVHIVISAFDHPNVVLKDPNYMPGAQSEAGLLRLLERYKTPDNPLYESRARGRSPQQAREALIRWEWLVAARDRDKEKNLDGPKALGVDVANSEDGDKAAIARGQGSVLAEVEDFQCPDANRLGARIVQEMKTSNIAPQFVGIDGVGVGAGTVNECKRLDAEIVNILSGSAPIATAGGDIEQVERFNNLRSQMWWQLRVDLQDPASTLCLPADEELFADLMTPKFTLKSGKIIVQSKEELRKKLGRSPNKGDAAVYWNWVRQRNAIFHFGILDRKGAAAAEELPPNVLR